MSTASALASALADRYRIEKELGQGGMATVYLATDVKHNRQVAVKVLRPDLAASLGADRFIREITIAAGLTHPHILGLHDSGEAGGFLYYVMPFVEGTSLREKLTREGELPITEAARILRDVADALAYAHRHKVVHRDIKPENVMLQGRHALVTDFGVAKAVSEATGRQQLTTAGVALGTPAYMAPEQATADIHMDHRVDLYAWGAMAYEVLTGRPPFVASSPQAVLAAHVTAQAEPVTRYRQSLPAPLARLVMQCLEKRPADRPQSADELVPQLESIMTPSGGMTPTDTTPITAAAPRRIWLGWRSLAIVVPALLLVVLGGMFTRRQMRKGKPPIENRILVVPFDVGGDSTLAGLQSVLEGAITDGLKSTGLVDVLDSRSARATVGSDESTERLSAPRAAHDLARQVRAAYLVSGRIVRLGDSVRIEPHLTATPVSGDLVPVAPLVGAMNQITRIADTTAQRVMGGTALHLDQSFGSFLPGIHAPTYDAYREYQEASRLFEASNFAESAERFKRAWERDTTFLVALVRMTYALENAGNLVAAESLGTALQPRRSRMSPSESAYLNRVLAWLRGDNEAALAAARDMARRAPGSVTTQYVAARSLIPVNRLAAARDALLKIDTHVAEMGGVNGWYSDLFTVYHALGDYQDELQLAQRLLAEPGDHMLWAHRVMARAQAGLDNETAAREQFQLVLASPGDRESFLAVIISELRWHGHERLAAELAGNVLTALGSSPNWNFRYYMLVAAGRREAAQKLADSVLANTPGDPGLINLRGVTAARTGNLTLARAMSDSLSRIHRPYDLGQIPVWRAEILSLAGDRDGAVEMLRQAMSQGYWPTLPHADMELENLRGYVPFEALVAPR